MRRRHYSRTRLLGQMNDDQREADECACFFAARRDWANTPDLKRRPGRQRQGQRWNFNSALRAVGAKQKTY